MRHYQTTRYTKTLYHGSFFWCILLLVPQVGCKREYPPTKWPPKDTTGESPAYTSVTREASRSIKKEGNNEEKVACGATCQEQLLSNKTDSTVVVVLPQESELAPSLLAATGLMPEDLDEINNSMCLQMNNAGGGTEEVDEDTQQPSDNEISVSNSSQTADMEEVITQLEEDFKEDYRQMEQALDTLCLTPQKRNAPLDTFKSTDEFIHSY